LLSPHFDMSTQDPDELHGTTETHTTRSGATFSEPPAWLQRAERSGKGQLLRQVLDFAKQHKLYLGPPHYILYHSPESTIPLNGVREKILTAVGSENREILHDLEISGLETITSSQLPFTKPENCCVRTMLDSNHYEVYFTQGTGWRLTNPASTCTYLVQSGISVRQLTWDTLVPNSTPRTVIGASQVRDYYTKPSTKRREPREEERTAFRAELQEILDRTRIRAGWYDLPDMVKHDRIRLAVTISDADFRDQMLETQHALYVQGWDLCEMTVKRDQRGEAKSCWPSY